MRYISVCWIWLCLTLAAEAQPENQVDSLLRLADDPRRLPESVILLLEHELPRFTSSDDQAQIHIRLSSAYAQTGPVDSCSAHAWKSIRLAPDNPQVCSKAYANLGYTAFRKTAFDRAKTSYEKALALYQQTRDRTGQFLCWRMLARIADDQSLHKAALDSDQQAMAIAMELQDSTGLRDVTFHMASLFRKLGRFAEAQDYLNSSLKASPAGSERLMAIYREQGMLHEAQASLRKAIEAFRKAQDIENNTNDEFTDYHNLLRVYAALRALDTATRYADSAEVAARRSGHVENLRTCFYSRYQLAELKGDTAEALHYHKQYMQFDDSVKRQIADQRVENVRDELLLGANEAAIRTAEWEAKWKEVNMLQEKQWKYAEYLILGILMLLILAIFLLYRSGQRRKKEKGEFEERIRELSVIKEKLFTVLARDLQAPLATFNNLTRSLDRQMDTLGKEDVKAIMHHLNTSSHELAQLLNQLLEWAFTQSGTMPFRPELLRCQAVAREVEELLRPLASEKGVTVSFLIPEGLHAYADRTMVAIILRTLLFNAIRFTPNGQTVTLFSGKKENLITLGLKDNGVGVSAHKLPGLFTWSSDPVGQSGALGMGIGLPMCRELVRRNGGDLYVESKVGAGTTFYFTLPEHAEVV